MAVDAELAVIAAKQALVMTNCNALLMDQPSLVPRPGEFGWCQTTTRLYAQFNTIIVSSIWFWWFSDSSSASSTMTAPTTSFTFLKFCFFIEERKETTTMSGISETLALRGTLRGRGDWVTSLATTPEDPNLLLSSSRDKSVIVWQLTHSGGGEDNPFGFARHALRGHSHFVSDVIISSDGAFTLSASWDSELRLWDIATGKTTRRFVGHA